MLGGFGAAGFGHYGCNPMVIDKELLDDLSAQGKESPRLRIVRTSSNHCRKHIVNHL